MYQSCHSRQCHWPACRTPGWSQVASSLLPVLGQGNISVRVPVLAKVLPSSGTWGSLFPHLSSKLMMNIIKCCGD